MSEYLSQEQMKDLVEAANSAREEVNSLQTSVLDTQRRLEKKIENAKGAVADLMTLRDSLKKELSDLKRKETEMDALCAKLVPGSKRSNNSQVTPESRKRQCTTVPGNTSAARRSIEFELTETTLCPAMLYINEHS